MPSTFRMLGAPVPIVDQVQMDADVPGAGAFTVSETGVLAYEAAGTSSTSRLMWVDRGGKKLGVVGDPLPYLTINLSPDGSRAASMISEAGQVSDAWIVDLTTGHRNRVTFDTGRKGNVVWSPEGTRIVYDSMRNGQTGIYQRASTGARNRKPVVCGSQSRNPHQLVCRWVPSVHDRHPCHVTRSVDSAPDRKSQALSLSADVGC